MTCSGDPDMYAAGVEVVQMRKLVLGVKVLAKGLSSLKSGVE